jgi:type IV pilus assembly protein PilM
MALSFLNAGKKREQLIAVDLGGRTTKAAYIERRSGRFTLAGFAIVDAPIYEKSMPVEMLAEHLKTICAQLKPNTKSVTLALGVNEALVRHTELPQIPIGDMRQVLKNNAKSYLQQDLPGYLFDCYIIPPRVEEAKADQAKPQTGPPKFRVLVAGAKGQVVDTMQAAIRSAGLTPDYLLPGLIGPVNAFEAAMPEVFSKEIVALVEIGFKNTTVCILQEGELALSRVVAIGGDRITSSLAEGLAISYAEAEGIKVGMPQEVESHLEATLSPLGRELRASIDFFEHQRDKAVSQVYLSGASAQSDFMVQILQREMMIECKTWNPLGSLDLALPPEQTAEIESAAPKLTTAIGAAYATF